MLTVGGWAYDVIRSLKVQVIDRTELWGYISYHVFDPISKTTYTVSSEHLSEQSQSENCNEFYVRYIAALAKIKNELAGGILSFTGDKILPLPHQIYALNRVLAGDEIRYLLADEVGLGKTIEAGLIIKELKMRGLVKKVLVVCPKGLVTQWQMEMQDKFGERFAVILPEDYDTIRRMYGNGNVFERFDNVICSMDSIKPLERRSGWDKSKIDQYNNERIYTILDVAWDLIVIDEAHRVAGSTGDVARYRLGNLLSKASPYLLLLTATPHSGKVEPFFRLMRLLDERAFPDYRAIVKEQIAPYIIRTEKREAVDHQGRRLFKDRVTKAIEIKWEQRHSMQKVLYEQVTAYVANGYNRAIKEKKYHLGFLMVLMQRLVTSSTAAIRDSIERRISVLEHQEMSIIGHSIEDLIEMDMQEALESTIAAMALDLKGELSELRSILAVAKQAEYQYLDAKAERLLDLLDRLFSEDSIEKVIIFTEFVATQQYLCDLLQKRGYAVCLLNGSMSIDERNAVLDEFKGNADILVSTDAGGEGINLQFCHIVINYDLPWNPMKIEQRIGRVDRIGQEKDVYVYNFLLTDTVENRVREVLEAKLAVIYEQLGIDKLSDVLDSELAEIDFTDVYMESIADPKHTAYCIDKLEEGIKEQVQQAHRIRELMKEEKTFDLTAVADINRCNISMLVRQMYMDYKRWNHEKLVDDKQAYDLNHPEVKKIVEEDHYWTELDAVPIINLPDLPNEKGYWSLWELSLSDDRQDKLIFPVFINYSRMMRPASAQRLWDEFLRPGREIQYIGSKHISVDEYSAMEEKARELAYDRFIEMKIKHAQRHQIMYNKYKYALKLRLEATDRVGLENVRKRRKAMIFKEMEQLEREYRVGQAITPVLKPVLIVCME